MNGKADFVFWWWFTGSSMRPLPNHDHEEHARRVAEAAWEASSKYQQFIQGEKEMSPITISETTTTEYIDIVFDGPPGPDGGGFVEVENDCGRSIRVGEWIERQDGFWALRIPAHNKSDPMPLDQTKRLAGLWSAGKMIGGDPQAACIALLAEIERLEKKI